MCTSPATARFHRWRPGLRSPNQDTTEGVILLQLAASQGDTPARELLSQLGLYFCTFSTPPEGGRGEAGANEGRLGVGVNCFVESHFLR
jgi:hypothetical protein